MASDDKTAKVAIRKKRLNTGTILCHILLILFAIGAIFPFVWMILTSLKTEQEATIIENFRIFPETWQWGNYKTLFSQHPMGSYYLNSIIYTLMRALPAIFLASLTGFVMAKYRFRGQNLFLFLVIGTLIVPFQLRLIPMADMLFGMGLKNEYWAVVLPGMLEPFGIFLFFQACKSIPDELLESARVDGCGIWRQYVHVVLPLIGPTIAAYAIFQFMWSWGEFLWAFIVITDTARMPLEVGIKGFSGEHYASMVHMMGAATAAVVPIIAVFLLLQRWFVKGVTMSGLKG